MANRMTPPAEGLEKDVLLVLDKQQGKVSAVKDIDKVHIPADTRSAFPVISVQSPVSIQCCWQS